MDESFLLNFNQIIPVKIPRGAAPRLQDLNG